jgi:hypothetical protein
MDQAAVARAQENQNALAQYTLGKAKREDEQQNKLYQAVQDPNFKLDVRTALQYGPQGMAALKAQQDAAAAEQTRALNQSQIAERQARLPGYVAEAFDKQMKPFSSAAYNSKNVGEGIASINAMYDNPALASVLTKIKSREQAIESTVAAFSDPKTMTQWQAYWGGITPDKLYTQATVSANTAATLTQAQQHFDGLSAYQKQQLLAQGKQFDSDRGVIVDVKNGTFEPVYSYPSSTPAAPAAIPTAPIATPAGTSITQPRAATPGTFPRVTTVQQTNNMESATAIRRQELANEQSALENARQKLATPAAINDPEIRRFYEERFKEATNNIDALNKELGNQPTQPSATQPAQRTVLGPKPEKATESYFKELKGVINTNDAINNLKQMVSTFTPADMLNPARRAEIDTAHKTAVLLAKEMFNLGVLNGGDQKILEQVIPDPISFSKGLVPIETIRKNLDAASSVASRMNATLSKVHKQPLVQLDTIKPNAPNPSAPPIESFRPSLKGKP